MRRYEPTRRAEDDALDVVHFSAVGWVGREFDGEAVSDQEPGRGGGRILNIRCWVGGWWNAWKRCLRWTGERRTRFLDRPMKLRSRATLLRVWKGKVRFERVLEKYYAGEWDERTLESLKVV
jgi:hypothetical protein